MTYTENAIAKHSFFKHGVSCILEVSISEVLVYDKLISSQFPVFFSLLHVVQSILRKLLSDSCYRVPATVLLPMC